MAVIVPKSRVGEVQHGSGAVEVTSYSKAWPCFFPQHGPGKKHERSIRLTDWQKHVADDFPGLLLRGLIHSDGCRFIKPGAATGEHRATASSTRPPTSATSSVVVVICSACGGPPRLIARL
ncbi:MAG: hypothetical protein ACR2ML_03310, partial [Solirubrobacteraceae bacterium]